MRRSGEETSLAVAGEVRRSPRRRHENPGSGARSDP